MQLRLALGLLLAATTLPAATVTTVTIQPDLASVPMGNDVSVSILISNITDLYAFGFDLVFSPDVLSAVNQSEGAFLQQGGTTIFVAGTIDNVGGTVAGIGDTLVGSGPGVDGAGTLATVDFQAIALASGTFSLANPIWLDSNLNDIAVTEVDAGITVNDTPEPGTWGLLLCGAVAARRFSCNRFSPGRR